MTNFTCQPGSIYWSKVKKKKNVRALTQLAIFARLAFTSPSKNCDKQMTFIDRVRL
jgi:hypothetical protein